MPEIGDRDPNFRPTKLEELSWLIRAYQRNLLREIIRPNLHRINYGIHRVNNELHSPMPQMSKWKFLAWTVLVVATVEISNNLRNNR